MLQGGGGQHFKSSGKGYGLTMYMVQYVANKHLIRMNGYLYAIPTLNSQYFKGTVSRELRPMLLYIIWKLFSMPTIASHKILILLKDSLQCT